MLEAKTITRGKLQFDAENQLILEIIGEKLMSREIYESGKLLDKTYEAIRERLNLGSIVATKHTAIVETIERFRIIFQASNDYLLPFKSYEKRDEIEQRIDNLGKLCITFKP
jgi:hypothetical protein